MPCRKPAALPAMLTLCLPLGAGAETLCTLWSAPEQTGQLDITAIEEASGMAISADGSRLYHIIDGNEPVFFVTDRQGQNPRQVTDRPAVNLDPVFSPDGATIAFVGCPGSICMFGDYEIYTIPVEGGEATRLTEDAMRDHDPYYSPDGTQIAWLTQVEGGLVGVWDVHVANADGSGARRLAGDDGVTSRPQWSADGRLIIVHRIPPGGDHFDIFEFQVDGSGQRELTADQPGNNEYPST